MILICNCRSNNGIYILNGIVKEYKDEVLSSSGLPMLRIVLNSFLLVKCIKVKNSIYGETPRLSSYLITNNVTIRVSILIKYQC